MNHQSCDFLIVGAGIVGLALARELALRQPACKIIVLEKETRIGMHASGRNSGVLHSGIYYPEGSMKARVCAEGAALMAEYCDRNNLPLDRTGKVIVPVAKDQDPQLDLLQSRAHAAGAKVEMLNADELSRIEPAACTATGRALFAPGTSVIDSCAVLNCLANEVKNTGVALQLGEGLDSVDVEKRCVHTNSATYHYGHLFNAAGLHADTIAHLMGCGQRYTSLPFKGIYYKLAPGSGLDIRHLIYPVPDLGVPFLGVHFTRSVDGTVYVGPTAVPVLGREQYKGLQNVRPREALRIVTHLGSLYLRNKQGFRTFAHQEGSRYLKSRFAAAARSLVPQLESDHLLPSTKVGIRPQLLDLREGRLEMDFVVEYTQHSTHILNAISPAFTCAFSFARVVIDPVLHGTGSKNIEPTRAAV